MNMVIKMIKLFIEVFIKKFKKWKADNTEYINILRTEGVKIGEKCDISKTAYFGGEPWLISIGNNTRITNDVKFITHDGGLWTLRKMGKISNEAVKYGNIIIGDNCNISWNVIIMPNVKIGNNCIIAAGAVVTKDVPDNTVWGGVPAKQIETIEEYYKKVKNKTVKTYSMSEQDKYVYLKENCPDLFREKNK